ncbi:bacteriohemerythrin [Clostridium folliculivorans]|uniref:Bacteriohemerythrin n=1 Tax=Clostridium folliculivorans TaxID=2886038 RepID=A0A9W5Y688_9CLOT|nr:hemerythrin family protein [Clostridium folliculivorans]GKU27319.1 bacteriohemerythrin [Clostridium folliculivorans]GKU32170.1 bacteriohemerythrin [Clostridium folliculivorans]
MFELTKEYETGVYKIDKEHRRLFELADECYNLLKEDICEDKYEKVKKVISELKNYAKFHFNEEEKLMESVKHKQIFTHKLQHDYFIEKIDDIDIDAIEYKQDQYIIDILTFIVAWIRQHILSKDVQYVSDVR